MPMSMLAGDGVAYRERLLSLSVMLAPDKFGREVLHKYVSTARPAAKAQCVVRTGWHGGSFIFTDSAVQPAAMAATMLSVMNGVLSDLAADVAARHQSNGGDELHVMRKAFTSARTRMAADAAKAAAAVPRLAPPPAAED